MPWTVCPSASKRRARWKPMKPAVPVTRTRIKRQSASADEVGGESRRDVVGDDLGGAELGVVHAPDAGEALLSHRVVGHIGGRLSGDHNLAGGKFGQGIG